MSSRSSKTISLPASRGQALQSLQNVNGSNLKKPLVTSSERDTEVVRLQSKLHFAARYNVIHISDIDTVAQKFMANFVVRLETINLPHVQAQPEQVPITPENLDPRIRFLNLQETSVWKRKSKWNAAGDQILLKYEISGIFSQQMQLRKFPFDVQSLKLQMSSAITEDKLSFCKFPNKPSVVQVQNFGSSNVFELHDMPFILGGRTEAKNSTSAIVRPVMPLVLRLRRLPDSFLYNTVVPMIAISGFTLFAFAIPISEVGDRLAHCITIILTAVAFKLMVAGCIPEVSFMTTADFFLFQSFIIITFVTIAIGLIAMGTIPASADRPLCYAFTALFGVFVLGWAFYFRRENSRSKARIGRPSYLDKGEQLAANGNWPADNRVFPEQAKPSE